MAPQLSQPSCLGVGDALARMGDKWSIMLVLLLRTGSRRFGELRRLVPTVSQRMLTLTLRSLERDGFVKRTVHPSVPPRVEYELTPLGHSLSVPMAALGDWALANESAIRTARSAYDARSTGS